MSAESPDALLHASETDSNPGSCFLKARQLLWGQASSIILNGENSVLFVGAYLDINGFASRVPHHIRQAFL